MLRKILTILSFLAVISVSAVHADQKKIGFIYIGLQVITDGHTCMIKAEFTWKML